MSKHKQTVILASQKGYHVSPEGEALNPEGKPVGYIQTKVRFGHAYSTHCITVKSDRPRRIATHMLQAYQKFGELIFTDKIHVRHLDGNSLNNSADNIAIGTAKQNSMDRTPLERLKSAYHATAGQRIPDDKWTECDADREQGMSFAALRAKYGFNKSTLSYRYSKTAKRVKTPLEVATSRLNEKLHD